MEWSETPTKSSSEMEQSSSEEEAGKFVRKSKHDSDTEESSDAASDISEDLSKQALKRRYNSLLSKLRSERQKKKIMKQRKPIVAAKTNRNFMNTSKLLAERIRGWQIIELEKHDDHKQQYHAWLAFSSIVEANWSMYGIEKDEEKLICLQTKCKGFVAELINSIHRSKPNFQDVWGGLQTRFYAPINSGEETAVFYQMKQMPDENIFDFFERVTKQAYLCNFSTNDYARNIGETFARNCLNPSYFLGIFDNFEDLDKLKHHAKNFHAALPKMKHEPVLAVNHQRYSGNFRNNNSFKRKIENQYDAAPKRVRVEPANFNHIQRGRDCKYCGGTRCSGRNCPARGQKCNYCRRFDHFERACLKKKSDAEHKNNNVNAVAKEENDEKVNFDDDAQ